MISTQCLNALITQMSEHYKWNSNWLGSTQILRSILGYVGIISNLSQILHTKDRRESCSNFDKLEEALLSRSFIFSHLFKKNEKNNIHSPLRKQIASKKSASKNVIFSFYNVSLFNMK